MRNRSGFKARPTLAGMALPLVVACSGGSHAKTSPGLAPEAPPAVTRALAQGTAVDPTLVQANNAMGYALFTQLRTGASAGNIAISPMSLGQCLGMIYGGAAGQTRQAMAQAMQLGGISPDQLNQDNAALMASLSSADPSATLLVANSLWARNDILPGFIAANQTYYAARIGTMDGAPGTVNAWVNQQTQGAIPTLLDPALDCAGLDAILVNALYFKGAWTTPFPPANTASLPFTRLDGTQTSCPMMSLKTSAGYNATAQSTGVRLPYGNGRYAMILVLPQPGVTLDALAKSLDGPGWTALAQNLASRTLTLTVPKFKASWSANLTAPLTTLGMGPAFDPLKADFTAMATQPLSLGFVVQKTTVEVDETGTTATAGTGGGMANTSVELAPTVTLDHPFFYVIEDTQTGELLFIGQMLDPTAG